MGTQPPTVDVPPLVQTWSASAQAVLDLADTLSTHDLTLPTDLPGWTVGDVLAHLAHLESELAGNEPVLAAEDAIPGDAADDPFRSYTERGVAARRGRSSQQIRAELQAAVRDLRVTLVAPDPAPPPEGFPRPGTTWQALLRDRIVDFWMHEQDIRRAVGRPGGWDSPGARHTIGTFAAALPFVVGKKVRPPAGTSVSWVVTGPTPPIDVTIRMDDDARARSVSGVEPDVRLVMSSEAFVLLAGGRRTPEQVSVEIDGDPDLGAACLAAMTVTP